MNLERNTYTLGLHVLISQAIMKEETRGRKRIPTSDYFKFHVSAMRKVVTNSNGIIQDKYILYWQYGFRDISQIQKDRRFEVTSKL